MKLRLIALSVLLAGCTGEVPELGINAGQLQACPSTPNCVSSQSISQSHYIKPLIVKVSPKQVRQYVLTVITSTNRAQMIESEQVITKATHAEPLEAYYIRAEFTSMLMRFVDDVEVYISPQDDLNTVIDMRSASRLGYSDFGVNRQRVEQLQQDILRLVASDKPE